MKYNFSEARYVLERASARESAARVAIGAIAKLFLRELGIEVLSHVITTGTVTVARSRSSGKKSARFTIATKSCSTAPTPKPSSA